MLLYWSLTRFFFFFLCNEIIIVWMLLARLGWQSVSFVSVPESSLTQGPLRRVDVCPCLQGLSSYCPWTSQINLSWCQVLRNMFLFHIQKHKQTNLRLHSGTSNRWLLCWLFRRLRQRVAWMHTKQHNYLSPSTAWQETWSSLDGLLNSGQTLLCYKATLVSLLLGVKPKQRMTHIFSVSEHWQN